MPKGNFKGRMSTPEAKSLYLKYINTGMARKDAVKKLGYQWESIRRWKYQDKVFRKALEDAERKQAGPFAPPSEREVVAVPDFATFRDQYLGQRTWPHQMRMVDLLEGRQPRDLHRSMTFHEGRPTRVIVNIPPGHAKSTTITSDYVTWRVIRDPTVRIIIVSKAQRLAEQFLLQIKERLTSPQYQRVIDDFAPPGGFDSDSAGWSASRFYVSSKVRGAEAKDPTLQALGVGGQIYGARADLIVVDDVADSVNAHDYDKQIDWLLTMAASRLTPRTGKLFVVGTRIAAQDIYSQLQDPSRYHGNKSPWTYLSQPAVLESSDNPEDWVTLWPRTDVPHDSDEEPGEDGLYPRWDGPTLSEVRNSMPTSAWSRMYQQEQIAEDSTFNPEEVHACIGNYPAGKLIDDKNLGRDGGIAGLRLIAGLDPASVGYTAAVLLGLDRVTGHRWVVDIHNQAKMHPDEIRALIKRWTVEYGVHEWRIESNAFQKFLALDRDVSDFAAKRGTVIHEHYTTKKNKLDPGFGVTAMTQLFKQGLITLPRQDTERARQLTEQLLTYDPIYSQSKKATGGHKTDIIMALWFAEIRAQELADIGTGQDHGKNPFQSAYDRRQQRTISVLNGLGDGSNYTSQWA